MSAAPSLTHDYRNGLIARLTPEDRSVLIPRLCPTTLSIGGQLETPGRHAARAVFPENGVLSVVEKAGGRTSDIGLIGCEGMSGHSIVLGDGPSTFDISVRIEGRGHWIDADTLRDMLHHRPSIGEIIRRYFYVFGIQFNTRPTGGDRFKLTPRLARLLLVARDRLASDDIPLTHDAMASILNVRRQAVMAALHLFEAKRLVISSRGVVRIRDRLGLETLSSGSYGFPEREYARHCAAPSEA